MTPLINLLPWRQRQRKKRMLRWSALFALVLILIPLLVASGRAFSAWDVRQLQVQNDYQTATYSALQHLYQQRLTLQEQNNKLLHLQQVRESQKQAIQVWETRLIQLASFLPAGTWLSSLSLQKESFVVKGHATALEVMQALEKELTQLEGVSTVRAGAMQHDAQGGFGFAFTLTLSEVANALVN
ncbi:MAG TPA: PilN domain-containing protein [Buttiauxella sp.]